MTTELELSSLPIIDWELAIKVAGNNKELAQDLLTLLCKTLNSEVTAIDHAYAEKQGSELLRLVHKLHGGVSYCGLPRLKKVLATLETTLKRNGEEKEVPPLLQLLKAECTLVLSEQQGL